MLAPCGCTFFPFVVLMVEQADCLSFTRWAPPSHPYLSVRSLFSSLQGVSSGDFCKPQHNPRIRHHSVRPFPCCSFFQQIEILRRHLDVDLDSPFHGFLYRSFAVAKQRYYWYPSYPLNLPVGATAGMPKAKTKRIPGSTFGMAGVFWVAFELARRNWIVMPTVRNQKGVDIIAARPSGSKFVELQVKAIQGRRFWLLGPMKRAKIPHRKSLFFAFVRPESDSSLAPFEGFVVPSNTVHKEAKQQSNKKFQLCWYLPKQSEIYKERWDLLR